ncbi:MAG: YegP family protein [Lachnospiraceae bacterium]|nr:YegP family protein [Lachnospiraceae bacterium]
MGKFVIKQAKNGPMFNLKAANGEIIGTSEQYSSLDACRNGIASVQKNAPIANLEDQTKEGYVTEKNPKFEIYKDKKGEFRFRLKAGNGETILTGEGYVSKGGCKNGITSIRRNAADSKIIEQLEA